MKNEKMIRRKIKRRQNLPQPIGQIITEDLPDFVTLPVRNKNTRHIISIQDEDGIPWHQVEKFFKSAHDTKLSKKDENQRRL